MPESTAYPLVTVGALIFNDEGQILLVQTHKWHHKFGLPGGKIEQGETAEKALIREIQEEVGLNISHIRFELLQEVIFSPEFYKPMHFIFLNYTCRASGQQTVVLNDEAQSYQWLLPTDALELPLNQPTYKLIEHHLQLPY